MKPNQDLEKAQNDQKKFENKAKKEALKKAKEQGRVVQKPKPIKPPKIKEIKIG